MNKPITCQMLHDKLRSFGFEERSVQQIGTTRRYFNHPEFETAILDLPDRPNVKAVPMYIGVVRAIVRRYGFISENDFVYH